MHGEVNVCVCVCVCIIILNQTRVPMVCSEDGKQRSGSVNGGIFVLFRLAD